MLVNNREPAEHEQIIARLDYLAAEQRANDKPPNPASRQVSLTARLRASRRQALARRIHALPLVGHAIGRLGDYWRVLSDPSVSRNQKLRATPVLGAAAAWLWGVLALVRFKEETLALLRHSQREIDELRRRLQHLHLDLERQQTTYDNRLQELTGLVGGLSTSSACDLASDLPAEFYLAFEEQFRGSINLIRERLSSYLPHLRRGAAGSGCARVVDVGCGRGEWLELLRGEGFTASGVDMNPAMVAASRDRGLDVTEADGIGYLLTLKPDSCAGITSFHLAEHLPPGKLVALFAAAFRALAPGGVLILETPNPENMQVAAYSFYMDPSHRHPLPPPLLDFMARYQGFADNEVLRLNPWPEFDPDARDEPKGLNKLLYCEQDYALVARKPGKSSKTDRINRT